MFGRYYIFISLKKQKGAKNSNQQQPLVIYEQNSDLYEAQIFHTNNYESPITKYSYIPAKVGIVPLLLHLID